MLKAASGNLEKSLLGPSPDENVELEDNMRPEGLHQEAKAQAQRYRAQTMRVVSLCMFSYANSERFNVPQMVLGYRLID